ncbi:MAG: eL32 family ribosomal protein [Nanoarchaeota archaeon]|nr:eL32 family ribosomal protein [Nanoarchaeota archaeon]
MKKHNFVRQDFHKKRLRKRWVKPRGLHSKIRLKHKGHARKVSNGYGSPRKLRGLSKEGLIVVLIHNEDGLNKVDKEKQGVIISRTVGTKNKILMLKKAKEKGIKILNIKVDDYLKKKEKESEDKLKKKKVPLLLMILKKLFLI